MTEERRKDEGMVRWRGMVLLGGVCQGLETVSFLPRMGFSPSKLALAIKSQ